MPTSLMHRNTMNIGNVDEQRAYQLAMELFSLQINGRGIQLNQQIDEEDILNENSNFINQDLQFGGKDAILLGNSMRKSVNMTETVPVPSSEHVAEIVGRQGCKIKALRAKTNTYIKTPVRGAEPVFVVTGRKEDVEQAKQEILSAAEHFSQIRASRRTVTSGTQVSSGSCSPTTSVGHVTMQVRVPYKVVGLVVGPKGATIKRIQQSTSTYIVTPGRDKEPVFEVTGLPENVEKAKEEIEKHIASRTGTDANIDLQIDDFNINGIESGYDHNSDSSSSTQFAGTYGNSIINVQDNLPSLSTLASQMTNSHNCANSMTLKSAQPSMCNNNPGAAKKISSDYALPAYVNFNSYNHMSSDSFEVDEGIGASGGSIFDPAAAIWSDSSSFAIQRSNSISVTNHRILPPGEDGPHPRTRRTNSDPLSAAFQRADAAFSSSSPTSSQGSMSPVTGRRNSSPVTMMGPPMNPSVHMCILCGNRNAKAALVPCGHSSFCMACANEICCRAIDKRICPICREVPSQAILIRNC